MNELGHSWTELIRDKFGREGAKSFVSLERLRRVAMRGRVSPIEVEETNIATLIERLRGATSVGRVRVPFAPLLERFERAVVWKPKPVKAQRTKVAKTDIERFEQLWRATKFYLVKRRGD